MNLAKITILKRVKKIQLKNLKKLSLSQAAQQLKI